MSQSDVPTSCIRAIFSDLDGTIVHFPKWFLEAGVDLTDRQPELNRAEVLRKSDGERRGCRLLPKSTMGDGVVSDRTVELVTQLRAEGVLFFIVTGARKSTNLERLPMLPPADAVVCESGSRIFRGTTAQGVGTLDTVWEAQLAPVCGPLEREEPPAERPEPLWRFCAKLSEAGFTVDTRSYYGCFRVDAKGDGQLRNLLTSDQMPQTLDWAMNLGKFDIFPAASGKANAVRYLQKQYNLRPEECACLFDDDNDLGMAACCGTHLLPGLTSDSVRRAVAEHPGWKLAANAGEGVFAIESLLEDLLVLVRAQGAGVAATAGTEIGSKSRKLAAI